MACTCACIVRNTGKHQQCLTYALFAQVSFLDAASTPCNVSFAQTCSLSKAWQELGCMQLRRDERQQLQHVFRLGAQHSIKRFLRISFSGHLLGQPSGQLPPASCSQKEGIPHNCENCLSLWHLSSVSALLLACNAYLVSVTFESVLRATRSL
jgi:hypothetical protein